MKSFWMRRIPRPMHKPQLLAYALIIGFGLFPMTNVFGQQKILQFKQLTLEDGLSSSIVRAILQDCKGYMWFGTEDGLSRYDGTNIIIYKNTPSDSGSLPENHVRAIFEDRAKNLFIGTWGGLSQYNRDLNRFVNFRFEKTSPLYTMELSVYRIVEDSLGNLWLATDNGLICLNLKNNTMIQYKHDPNNPASISNNTMDCVYIDKSGRLWVGTRKGLNLFNPQTSAFVHITRCKTHNDSIADTYFLDIIEDREGNIWFGSADGIFCLEKGFDPEKMALSHFKNNPQDPTSLSINFSRTLFEDDKGNLWIGTENGGINLYNRDTKTFTHYRIEDFNSMSINNESIHAMIQDSSKNFWVGTWGGGVNIASYASGFIRHYKNLPGAPQSLGFNIVSGFAEDRFGRKWVGTDGGGFNLFDEKTGRFFRFNSKNTSIKSDGLNCVFEGTDDLLWMGAWEGGLIRFNYTNNTVTSLMKNNSTIPDNTIYSIAQDSKGNLWLGSFRHGLMHYQIKENTFSTYAPKQINLDNTEISVVRTNRKDQVFFGTNNGSEVFIFTPEESRFDAYTIMPDSTGKGTNSVFDILIENDTCTWVATQKGLYRFNPLSRQYAWFFREDGATGITIKGLTLDKTGILWVTTNAGLYRFDHRKNAMKRFTTSDGLQSSDFYRSSILTTKNGSIMAGGSNGFNLISPEQYSENQAIPQVIITDFHLFNEKVKVGAKGSPLQKQISETRRVTLSYQQSVLTFYFAVMDFSSPDRNLYAYWMENFDKTWIHCGNKKEATYTNLNPGTYLFHVKGSNNDGVWNERGTTLELVITPPWWETGVARAVFIVLIILVLLWVYYYFRGKQEQKHLREMVASQKKVEDILHAIDEAILTVNEDMTVNTEHSQTAEKIFGAAAFEKQNIASLFNMDDATRLIFERWLKMVFKREWSIKSWEKAARLNPIKEVVLEREGTIYLSVHYQPIYEDGVVSRIMVIANDITVQKKIEHYLAALNDERALQMERVFGLVSNDYESVISILDLAASFIQSYKTLNFDQIEDCKPRLRELCRDLHTLKGTGGSMGFETFASCCDTLEEALKQDVGEKNHLDAQGRERIDRIFEELNREMQAMVELRLKLYSGKEDKLSIDKTDFAALLEGLKKDGSLSIDEIIYRIRMLNSLKFSEFCAEFAKMVSDYGKRYEKSIGPLHIETPDVRIERKVCKALKGPVTHLIRNAVDHGIEDDVARQQSGKGPGRISMAVRDNNGNIEVEIVDDGKGIDPGQVAASAIKKGFLTMEQSQSLTDAQKRDLIFLHGFSTKEETTTISGRGVGMDAVKVDIEKAGGGVRLDSRVGHGTHMILWVPKMPV
jgi:ligand-binding sensor domain-containing protein/HPt (histidine-containing phosphotransfer) domain-containing protein